MIYRLLLILNKAIGGNSVFPKGNRIKNIMKRRKTHMKITKILALVLALCMVALAVASCNDGKKPSGTTDGTTTNGTTTGGSTVVNPKTPTDPYAGKTHAEVSDDLYQKVLGEFNEYYQKALVAKSTSERFALMAIAEAKLLGQGVMLPSSSKGGNYAISRVAPYTITSVLWGNDSDRFHQAVIVKGDPLTPEVRDEMKAKWAELKGTGTYEAWAKSYLTGKGYELNDVYTLGYTSDPTTWDALATSQAADAEAIVNTYDGLLEYDVENVQRFALAESYEVSEDGLTYTFHLRKGVKWVDYQGNVIEDVTATSFVRGMQHMMDAQEGLEFLVDGKIKNATEYMAGEITDFDQVGVKAVDAYTLVYTLEAPCSFFTTMLGYGCFAPISEKYFRAKGGAFGMEEYAAAKEKDTYTYGTSFENIAYCGPYLVTSATEKNSVVFDLNPTYWNKDNVNLKKIVWRFIDGQDPTESYTLMKDGTFAGAGLDTQAIAKAKEDGMFDKYSYVSGTDATAYPMFLNLYRAAYANFNDATVAVSQMNDMDKVRTNLAMENKNFRLAIVTALDRSVYNATTQGDDLKYKNLVNSYVPGTFVSLEEDVTVKIGGEDKTFKKGTYYGEILQAQLDADGIKVKVWDPTADEGVGSSAGFDGWYNVDYARESLKKAIEELKAEGVEISKENPIILELPYFDVNQTYANRANALKQTIESSLEGLVEIRLIKCGGSNALNWYYAGHYPSTGDGMNYNIMDNSGWGPDYGDPSTYLDTMLPDGDGYMTKSIGLY